jgi:hypothetical protein
MGPGGGGNNLLGTMQWPCRSLSHLFCGGSVPRYIGN